MGQKYRGQKCSKLYKLPFGGKICGSKSRQIFRGFIFAYDVIVTILCGLIFAFAISVLLIFNVFNGSERRALYKITKTQKNHAHNNK